jgi:hypothetical protein
MRTSAIADPARMGSVSGRPCSAKETQMAPKKSSSKTRKTTRAKATKKTTARSARKASAKIVKAPILWE